MEPQLKNCEQCNKGFTPTDKRQRFCSGSCRAKASALRTASQGNFQVKQSIQEVLPSKNESDSSMLNLASSLSPSAVIIVDFLKKDRDSWEKLYDAEKAKREKVELEEKNLRDEIAKIKVDQKIKDIENAKPGGLQGFMESPLAEQLMPHLAPVLGKLAERMLTPEASQLQIAGTDGQLDQQSVNPTSWITQMPESTQQLYVQVNHQLSNLGNVDRINYVLTNILNLLKNGSTAKATGTFGY